VKRRRRFILSTAAAAVLLLPAQLFAQSGTITGVVTNRDSAEPLSGVEVAVTGTTLSGITNDQGRYLILNVPAGTHTVTGRFIGFAEGVQRNVAVRAGESAVVDIALVQTALTLQALTVSATTDPVAGVKSPFSVGTISRENVATVPTTQSALTAIQGKVAGTQVVRNTGEPGTGVTILLRTPTSISQGNSPLFVVDGVILSGVGGTTLDLEALDIENVEIIKGAAAASLYGSRAGSGVISITTSRGRGLAIDQTRIRVRSEFGVSALPTYKRINTSHPYAVTDDGKMWVDFETGEPTPYYSRRMYAEDRVSRYEWPGQLYDNVRNVMRGGAFATNSVELSHNAASTNFMATINRYAERGALVNNNGYERGNIRVNLDHRLRSDFSFAVTAYHNRSERDRVTGSPFFDMLAAPPTVNLAAKDPITGKYLQQADSSVAMENPLWRQSTRDWKDKRARTLLSGNARYNPFSWLTVIGNASYDRSDNHEDFYLPKGTPLSVTNLENVADGQLDKDNQTVNAINMDLSATMMRNFGDLTTRVTARGNMEREDNSYIWLRGLDFVVQDVPRINMARERFAESSLTERRASGMSVATGLDYGGKYILDALIRRDGSSLFGPEERWQTYGRVAAAYRMAQEPWWPSSFVTEFKPRFAYGTAGGRPGFSAQYETWSVNGQTGRVSKNTLGNRFLKPEHTVEYEMGIDMIFNHKYQLELTHARQTTTDQIINMTIPALSGYSTQWQNAGAIAGETWEATFQAQLYNERNFSWNTTLVWDHTDSRITEWNRSCIGASDSLGELCEGRGLGDMLGFRFLKSRDQLPEYLTGRADEFDVNDDGYLVWVGAGNTWRDGVAKSLWGTTTTISGYPAVVRWGHPILEQNEDGFFNSKVDIGNSRPAFQLGWLNNLNVRGLALHTHFHAQVGGHTYNNTRRAMYTNRRHSDVDQRGKPVDEQKPVDYYMTGLASGTWFVNEHFVEDASYLKLRALSAQYRLGKPQLERIRLDRIASAVSVGLIGRNLLTISPYTGLDPEVGGVFFRVDQWYYPPARTLTGIVEITF
jgi:TonB-linked SusC/RagA family outer membrane protein